MRDTLVSREARWALQCASAIWGQEACCLAACDKTENWDRFLNFSHYHGLIPAVYLGAKRCGIELPAEVNEVLRNTTYLSMVQNQRYLQEYKRLSEVFEAASISMMPIKGADLLQRYSSQNQSRPMADIDILVQPQDVEAAAELLCSQGYQEELLGCRREYWQQSGYHRSFLKPGIGVGAGIFVELHWLLDNPRPGPVLLPELWERSAPQAEHVHHVRRMSPEDVLFALALHNRRFAFSLSLKMAFDTADLLRRHEGDFDWDYVLKTARNGKMRATLFFCLSQAALFFGARIQDPIWKALGISMLRRSRIQNLLLGCTEYEYSAKKNKQLFLRTHWLLHDNYWEPLRYILQIPQEQFAKYYGLEPYTPRTECIHRWRLPYMLWNLITEN
ncbi:MAG: nucleotidyltransferase family protein [Candidatus Omnitrophica bacterium]|nr:nucleotidyltransferase family protein [Candidatus Omnitrophota bacterium]